MVDFISSSFLRNDDEINPMKIIELKKHTNWCVFCVFALSITGYVKSRKHKSVPY